MELKGQQVSSLCPQNPLPPARDQVRVSAVFRPLGSDGRRGRWEERERQNPAPSSLPRQMTLHGDNPGARVAVPASCVHPAAVLGGLGRRPGLPKSPVPPCSNSDSMTNAHRTATGTVLIRPQSGSSEHLFKEASS